PHQNQPTAHSSILELWMFGGIGAVTAAGAVLVFAGLRASCEFRRMARRGAIVGVPEACYLAAAIALFSYWIETTVIGSPFDETINSVLLALVLMGVPPDTQGAGGIKIRVLSGPMARFGYSIILGLGLRTLLG